MHPATDIAGICARAWSLAEPLVRQAGLDLFDIEYKPDRGRMVLRVYLQRPGGRVSLDELGLTRKCKASAALSLECHDQAGKMALYFRPSSFIMLAALRVQLGVIRDLPHLLEFF